MAFLNKPASKIHKADLQAWRDRRLEQVSGASVNREMNLVSAIFNHAIREWGVGMVNPVKGVRRPAKAESRRRRVADSEVEALKEYFGFDLAKPPRRGYGSSKDSVMWIFLLALETGMRLGEICGTRWGNVHVEERYIRVPKELAKNGYARNVPLTKYACKIIEALPRGEGDGLVFPPSSEVVGALFRKGCKNLGLVNLHFHDTRHEACTKLARKLSILELADAIGHRELKSLQTYFNPEPHEIASKLD
jgi:integrase